MNSRHLVDPALLPLIDTLVLDTLSDATMPAIRAQIAAMSISPEPRTGPAPRETVVPGAAGDPGPRVLLYEPPRKTQRAPAILHIHGGGYVFGAPEGNDTSNAGWSAALEAVVISVDYRLAPEHPFPCALDDCMAALRWMHANAASLDVDPGRIAIMGESAGGGLAACVALRARDEGGLPLTLQMLAYPMLDDRTGSANKPHDFAGEFIWTEAHNRYGWTSYLGGRHDVIPARYAAAARAEDLHGLPPCFLSVGALDLFIDEDIAYAQRLIAAGVPTELHVHPGGVHAFDLMPGTRIGADYARERLEAMRRALHESSV